MSSAVTNGSMDIDDNTVSIKPKKAKKNALSGMMVIRKKDLNRTAPEKTAVKSKQNMMESDVDEQIFKCQIPTYKPTAPPVPPVGSNIQAEPETFFSCLDCGDKFLFESSLKMHLSRRSVKISMWRPGQIAPQIFFNRCKLLACLRQQMGPSTGTGLSAKISIQPLEREHLFLGISEPTLADPQVNKPSTSKNLRKILPKIPTAPSLDEETLVKNTVFLPVNKQSSDNIKESKPTTSKIMSTSHPGTSTKLPLNPVKSMSPPLVTEINESVAIASPLTFETEECMQVDKELVEKEIVTDKCPECNIKLLPGTNLKQHFAGKNIKSSNYKCNNCNILLPTNCSLKSHERLHLSDIKEHTNFICPECGVKFTKWDSFFNHLHNDCMHAYYSECFKCQNCSNMFATAISLEVHILKIHIKKIYKCSTCNIACYSIPALEKHWQDLHDEGEGRSVTYQLCQLCPGRLVTQSHLLFHVHQHAEDKVNSMLCYVCQPCSVFVENKNDFIDHKQVCNLMVSKFTKMNTSMEEKDAIDIPSKSLRTRIPKKSVIKEATIKIKNYKSNNIITKSTKRKSITYSKSGSRPCHKCGTTMQPYKYKMLACFNCNKSLINKTLKKSNSSKSCSRSPKLINGNCSEDSNNSIIKVKEEVNCTETNLCNENFECTLCNVVIGDDYDTIKEHFSVNHEDICNGFEWCPTSYKENITDLLNSINNSGDDGVILSSKFTCNICQFQTDEEEEFRDHVVTHRPGQSPAFQCMECGMCYVVKPSLEKHLLLTHKIRGVDEYLRESGQNHDEELGIEGPPLKENQCKVCYQEFESAQELNSHMRTHGMAFLLNKRGSDLLRSP